MSIRFDMQLSAKSAGSEIKHNSRVLYEMHSRTGM